MIYRIAAGTTQLCAGQLAGIEAGVHSVWMLFEKMEIEAALLVNASNAFNSLNQIVAYKNISPSLAIILINTYRESSQLFVDGKVLLSREGTTQGGSFSNAYVCHCNRSTHPAA